MQAHNPGQAGPPKLSDYVGDLHLPADFAQRQMPAQSTDVYRVMRHHATEVKGRAFITGLYLAFIAVAEDLLAREGRDSVADVLTKYPPQTVQANGRRVNTLNIPTQSGVVHLRGHYNAAESVIRGKLRRYGFPSMAPHATQAWPQHTDELETIFGMTPGERRKLAERLWDQILGLPDFAPRAPAQATVRPFSKVLQDFPGTQPGEPSGALLQGLAYAYYRADAPNVTLEVRGSRTGSRRIGAVADVDGWSGSTLALSIEVKDEPITENDLDEFNSFLANLREHGDATAIALAQSFTPQARADLDGKGLLVMDRATMIANVALWDLRKQQVAMQALDYYLWRIEKDPPLLARFRQFVEDEKLSLG